MLSDRQSFLACLEKSHLLSDQQLAQVHSLCGPAMHPRELATQLVQKNWLTRWQAQQILAGRTKLFLGKYKLLESLGKGGMGAVFKAEQPGFGRIVALKVMSRDLLRNPDAVARFQREIRSAGALSHPHIVPAFDADCVGDTYFLVMECVEGMNLREWVHRHKPSPIPWACECARQTALALQHAFERGMVHRDIKPANLLLQVDEHTGQPTVKVLDFGLARLAADSFAAGDLTQSGEILGSPDYIAPEQAENTKMADIRADIFSLGCTLFELLTGQVPFGGQSVIERLMARMSGPAPRPSSLRPEISASLDQIVARMLARDPAQRFQTPAEVAAALAPFSLNQAGRPPALSAFRANATVRTIDTVDAHADDSLNGFLNQLADHAADGPHAAPPARAASRIYGHRVWLAGGVLIGCLALFVPLLSTMRSARPGTKPAPVKTRAAKSTVAPPPGSEIPPSATVNKSRGKTSLLDGGAELSANSDRDIARWVLQLGGALRIAMNGRESEVYLLPDGTFRVVGINLFQNREIDDADLERLRKLSHLKSLILRKTRISDAGLRQLESLNSLENLNIAETQVSDAGVRRLGKLHRLENLNVGGNSISGATIAALKKELPKCEIMNLNE